MKGLIDMFPMSYSEMKNEFRHYLKDDVWTKEDIKGYVEYLKDEYELSDEDCKLLQHDFETIYDNEYIELD